MNKTMSNTPILSICALVGGILGIIASTKLDLNGTIIMTQGIALIIFSILSFFSNKLLNAIGLIIIFAVDLYGLIDSISQNSDSNELTNMMLGMIPGGESTNTSGIISIMAFIVGIIAIILIVIALLKPNSKFNEKLNIICIVAALSPILLCIALIMFYMPIIKGLYGVSSPYESGIAMSVLMYILYAISLLLIPFNMKRAPEKTKVNSFGSIKNAASNIHILSVKKEAPKEGPEELIKYKELLDLGIFTEEEFEKKKHDILG